MPKYFFDLADGSRNRDDIGSELADLPEARVHAIKFAGIVLGAEPQLLTNSRQLRVEVRDEARRLLVTVLAIAIDAESDVSED